MNLQQLYYFRAIAELEHFTNASEKLNITQPSLSHSINALESELGVHLFERHGRNVKLTKYGAIFLDYVQKSLDILDEGRNKLDEFIHPEKGVVSLSFLSSLEEFIPYVLANYYARTNNLYMPFVFYQQPAAEIEQSLLDGTADLAFVSYLENEKLESHKIGVHNVALIVSDSHPLAQFDAIDLSELGGERFIIYDHKTHIRRYIDQAFELAGIKPVIVAEATPDAIIYSLVAANFGIALMPDPLAVKRYNVKSLRIENKIPDRSHYLIWKKVRNMSPSVKGFRDFVIMKGLLLDEYRRNLIAK